LLDLKIFFISIFKVFSNADNENTKETVAKVTESSSPDSSKEVLTADTAR